jgi:hypothetical protein
VTEQRLPQERDLPAGRLTELQEDLMALIEDDLDIESRTKPVASGRRWRRIGLTAAAAVTGLALATSLVLTGDDNASANTAVRNEDGTITVSIHEGKNPQALQRRLNDLGVPAVVDFLDSGFGCDPARSTGWVEQPTGEPVLTSEAPSSNEDPQFVLHPDRLESGETAAFEFQIDEQGEEIAANVTVRLSTGAVGPCEPVPDASVVDAEAGTAGG